MAQHDYIISNQTFPNTRSDINNLASAIATNNSGSSAPSTQYAGQLWINTSSSTWSLFIHDGSDDIQLATIDTSANTVNFLDSVSGVTVNNNADNRVITGSGTANTLEGEANLTFDGTDLDVGASAKISSNGAIANFSNHNGSATETALATSDGNEKVRCFNDGKITFENAGTEKMRIASTGKVGIGESSPLGNLHVKTGDTGASSVSGNADELVIENTGNVGMTIQSANDGVGNVYFGDVANGSIGRVSYDHSSNFMSFNTNASERMRIDSSGRVKINTTDSNAHLQVHNTGNATYTAFFRGNTTETVMLVRSNSDSGNNRTVDFVDQDSTLCGSINVNAGGNTVSYETSSDYRLKENVIDLTSATTRIKNLKPKRFNFKAKPDTTLDGFLAHEVQSVIPEAASGTKDATETKKNIVLNNKGNVEHEGVTEKDWKQGKIDEKFANDTQWFAEKEFIKPQGVDTSKLVPLLTAALKEAITKIETLEARVQTLENA